MQNSNIVSKNFNKRFSIITSIVIFLGLGILVFAINQNFLSNFHLYYLKTYKDVIKYRTENIKKDFQNGFASVLNLTAKKPFINKDDEKQISA